MTLTALNRFQAFIIHLGLSLVIFAVLLLLIMQFWYPGFLFTTSGGWDAVRLIIGVDLILGPLLTLLVFNPKKASLKKDLSVIALVQTLALAWGTHTIFDTRPVALGFFNNEFVTLYAGNPITDQNRDLIAQSDSTPALLYYDMRHGDYGDPAAMSLITPDNLQALGHLQHIKREETANGQWLISLDSTFKRNQMLVFDPDTAQVTGLKTGS